MAITKKYIKSKKKYKIAFTMPEEISKKFKPASVVGDFNSWDSNVNEMKKNKKTGEFKATIELPEHQEYKFRYLLDGEQWSNDESADKYIITHFGDSEDCVIVLD
ncbi:hypothetical protein MNBD_IGNAVI01-817 [hydrothermal vent metagenome]|uniref:Glycoside hydrolase family 13 N-terminal domain-containing protein n=1 Tax=hydrothermal vent metagenome TaxID=652676 RepID=A0A3B1C9L7_9ZZZZ